MMDMRGIIAFSLSATVIFLGVAANVKAYTAGAEIIDIIDSEAEKAMSGLSDPAKIKDAGKIWDDNLVFFSFCSAREKTDEILRLIDSAKAYAMGDDKNEYLSSLFNLRRAVDTIRKADLPTFLNIT